MATKKRSSTPRKSPQPKASIVSDVKSTEFPYPKSFEAKEPFSTPHTVSVLLVLVGFLIYSVSTHVESSVQSNVKTGIFMALLVGLIFCAEHLRDTLFVRPHPAIWRFVTGVGLFYSMFIAFALFQNISTMRYLMTFLDSSLTNSPLPERSYGDACDLTWENIKFALLDEFVIAHLVGWIFKAAILRDIWLSMVISVLFEIAEYTFTYLQPNFIECWWDHWILDFLICNTGGILVGHLLMQWLHSREYNWRGVSEEAPQSSFSYVLNQFTPKSLMRYDWSAFSNFKRFMYIVVVILGILVVELDAFFLKDMFWVPPSSPINVYRLVLIWAVCMTGLRDLYQFIVDEKVKRLGSTAWVMLAMIILEFLVVLKFGYMDHYVGKYPPAEIVYAWGIALTLLTGWCIWWFGFELPRRKKTH
jgi:phosphatidylserine synthase 2